MIIKKINVVFVTMLMITTVFASFTTVLADETHDPFTIEQLEENVFCDNDLDKSICQQEFCPDYSQGHDYVTSVELYLFGAMYDNTDDDAVVHVGISHQSENSNIGGWSRATKPYNDIAEDPQWYNFDFGNNGYQLDPSYDSYYLYVAVEGGEGGFDVTCSFGVAFKEYDPYDPGDNNKEYVDGSWSPIWNSGDFTFKIHGVDNEAPSANMNTGDYPEDGSIVTEDNIYITAECCDDENDLMEAAIAKCNSNGDIQEWIDWTTDVESEDVVTHHWTGLEDGQTYYWKYHVHDLPYCSNYYSDLRSFTVNLPSPNNPPVADAGGPYSGVEGSAVSFDGSDSYDPDGSIVSYDWDFGDGNTGSGMTVNHVYSDAGTYTATLVCTDDDIAEASDDATVTITAVQPPDVRTDHATYTDCGIVVLHGTILNDGGQNCSVGFRCREKGSSDDWVYATDDPMYPNDWWGYYFTGDHFSTYGPFPFLDYDVDYEFQAGAKNSGGTSWGDLVYATQEGQLFPVVETNNATDITAKSAVFHATLIDTGEYDSCTVSFSYREVGYSGWFDPLIRINNVKAGESVSELVNGLEPDTKYEFRACAFNPCVGSEGTVFSFKTIDPVKPVVETKNATDIAYNSAVLHGTLIDTGIGSAGSCSVRFRYREVGSTNWLFVSDWHGTISAGESFSEVLDDLTKNTNYEFQAGAKNGPLTSWGLKAWGNSYFFTTKTGSDAIEDVEAEATPTIETDPNPTPETNPTPDPDPDSDPEGDPQPDPEPETDVPMVIVDWSPKEVITLEENQQVLFSVTVDGGNLGDTYYARFHFDDGTHSDVIINSDSETAQHSYDQPGTYYPEIEILNQYGGTEDIQATAAILIETQQNADSDPI